MYSTALNQKKCFVGGVKLSFDSIPGLMMNVPATILRLLGFTPPESIPPAGPLGKPYNGSQVVCCMLDNFGLFEIITYKPEFLVILFDTLLMLDTTPPWADTVFQEAIKGSLTYQIFNLFNFLEEDGEPTCVIGRESITNQVTKGRSVFSVKNDMEGYIQAIKSLNRFNLLFLTFSDFDDLHKQYIGRLPPRNLVQKVLTRTSNWLKIFHKNAKPDTVFLILGNHGARDVDFGYQGEELEKKRASCPVGILARKSS